MKDLDAFFARYAERYMASDVDAVNAMYEAPLLALREGRAIHLADRTAVRAHLAEVMAAYARSGAARADVAALDVVPLGKSSVFATVRWQVRDASGGLLKDFRTTYHLVRATDHWQILSYTNHDD
jgi:hypothetical protein